MTRPGDVARWLDGRPDLSEMIERYPREWDVVQRELDDVLDDEDPDRLRSFASRTARAPDQRRPAATPGLDAGTAARVRQRMAAEALRQMSVAAATGVRGGRVRFGLLNGWVAQRLLFEHDLRRKPVRLRRFQLVWPLLWQRRRLLPLVQPRGIYCFYSDRLIDELVQLIGSRSCLEIAAGDGTLARFLNDAGAEVTATDDQSWSHAVEASEGVRRVEARQALRQHRPEVVLCSWPPAGNPFERHVFLTPSVQTYVVISSRHEHAAGNWQAYRAQRDFDLREEPALSRLVLPPELDPAVYVFRRRAA